MARLNRTRVLSEAIATSFSNAGYSPADLLQGPISITDLPWQAPPLKAPQMLLGVPLHEYLDYPLPLNAEELHAFYRRGLELLRFAPEEFSTLDGHRGMALVFQKVPVGERKMAFPLPEDWPVGTHATGAMFAMEVARVFRTSCAGIIGFVEDASNYYAETQWGQIGVVSGFPSVYAEAWDADCSNAVAGMLEMPRGIISMTCHYDLIARLRSVLHENLEKFPEFEGVDYALQTLRILSDGQLCKELVQAVERMSVEAFKRKARVAAFKEALGVMEDWQYVDRLKVSMLVEILVPTHMRLEDFAKRVYDPRRILPAVLSRRVESRIVNTLKFEINKAENGRA
jgi:hypothetical protein